MVKHEPSIAVLDIYPAQPLPTAEGSNPLGCKHHRVCPSRGPIGTCDFRVFDPPATQHYLPGKSGSGERR